MAQNSLLCADAPLRNYSLTQYEACECVSSSSAGSYCTPTNNPKVLQIVIMGRTWDILEPR